jgi:hypothetical protein
MTGNGESHIMEGDNSTHENEDEERRLGHAVESIAVSTTVYLTLGDGDFTYSADLAVYLSSMLNAQGHRSSTDSRQ